ncbi:MAG: hypothetical protein WDW38_002873 [Sanguina aurantia]
MVAPDAVEDFCTQLRRRLIEGSLPCAKKTAEIMRVLVTSQRHADAAALIEDVRAIGNRIQSAQPVELAIGNIVRRVLHIIREEAKHEELLETSSAPSSSTVTEPVRVDVVKQTGGGMASLLSQQLRSPSMRFSLPRGMSLSNLLDVSVEDTSDQLAAASLAAAAAAESNPTHTSGSCSSAHAADIARQVSSSSASSVGGGEHDASAAAASAPSGGHAPGVKGPKKQSRAQWKGKHEVIDSINELIDELDTIQASITASGIEYIHANEVILTSGMSDTTFYFLKEASKKRDFQVIVAEGAPRFDGHLMARKLSDAGIMATVIADSAVFAMMARANKVLVGAHAVLADGGVIAPVGIHVVALAAKKHSIPFVVLVGLHKLSPLFPHDPDLSYNDFKSPADGVDFDVVAEAFSQQEAMLAGPAPASDRASGPAPPASLPNPPKPTWGGHTPSYVYRLLTEYYSREDYSLVKDVLGAGR